MVKSGLLSNYIIKGDNYQNILNIVVIDMG